MTQRYFSPHDIGAEVLTCFSSLKPRVWITREAWGCWALCVRLSTCISHLSPRGSLKFSMYRGSSGQVLQRFGLCKFHFETLLFANLKGVSLEGLEGNLGLRQSLWVWAEKHTLWPRGVSRCSIRMGVGGSLVCGCWPWTEAKWASAEERQPCWQSEVILRPWAPGLEQGWPQSCWIGGRGSFEAQTWFQLLCWLVKTNGVTWHSKWPQQSSTSSKSTSENLWSFLIQC